MMNVNEKDFEREVLNCDIPVLVDFWAAWCGPCKMIAPSVEELSREFAGKIKIVKVDVDNNQNLASRYGIMSIPSLIFFKNGKVMDQSVGALNKAQLRRKIEDNLSET